MRQFLLILRSNRSVFDALPRDQQSAQIARYNTWVGGLVEQGIFEDGLGLAPGHYEIAPEPDGGERGPVVGTEPVITGMFKVRCEDYDSALAIARSHPALGCGETVMVYQVGGA